MRGFGIFAVWTDERQQALVNISVFSLVVYVNHVVSGCRYAKKVIMLQYDTHIIIQCELAP